MDPGGSFQGLWSTEQRVSSAGSMRSPSSRSIHPPTKRPCICTSSSYWGPYYRPDVVLECSLEKKMGKKPRKEVLALIGTCNLTVITQSPDGSTGQKPGQQEEPVP